MKGDPIKKAPRPEWEVDVDDDDSVDDLVDVPGGNVDHTIDSPGNATPIPDVDADDEDDDELEPPRSKKVFDE
jgi:hypothetical protein